MVLGGTGTVWGGTGRYLVLLGQFGVVLGGTESVLGGSGWYLVVQGQNWVVQVGTWWFWVSITQYCLVLSCIGSAKGLYACIYWKKWRFGQVTPMPDRQQNIELLSFSTVSSLS